MSSVNHFQTWDEILMHFCFLEMKKLCNMARTFLFAFIFFYIVYLELYCTLEAFWMKEKL